VTAGRVSMYDKVVDNVINTALTGRLSTKLQTQLTLVTERSIQKK